MINVRHAIWIKGVALALLASMLAITLTGRSAPEASAQTEAEAERAFPYMFTAPEDWRTEVVTFPLSFAPELDYQGHGDVRFAPGMFAPETEDFWTYTFVWWLPSDANISAERLSTDMNTYFTGLAKLVTRAGERELPEFPASAVYTGDAEDDVLQGRIETLDAFATHSPIALNSEVTQIKCPAHDRKAVLFAFSPKPKDHPNWAALGQIKADFSCDRE